MDTFLRGLLERITGFFSKMERGQRIRLIVLSTVLVGVLITAIVLLTRTEYAVLYSNLKAEDAGTVMARLQELGIETKTENSDTIMVPKSQVDPLRWQLASEGYGIRDVSYDTYQLGSAFGANDDTQRFYEQAQLQEDVRRAIMTYEKIESAEVQISLGVKSNFVLSKNETPASASIYVRVKEDQRLTDKEARTMAELVATAVPGLSLENIRIADTKMRIYNLSEQPVDEEVVADQARFRETQEKALEDRVVKFLAPVFGEENVSAQVHMILNFDTEVSQSTILSPPVEDSGEGIVISMKELTESIRGYDTAEGVPGTGTNGFDSYPTDNSDGSDVYYKASTEVNRDVNEVKTQIERAKGTITDMSVGVLINANNVEEDYTGNDRTLLSNALGLDVKYISVDRLPFQELSSDIDTLSKLRSDIEDARNFTSLMNAIIIAVAIIVAAILILLIFRSFAPPKPVPVENVALVDAATGMELDITVDEDVLPPAPPEPTNLERIIDFVKSDPESVASLLRNWLQD